MSAPSARRCRARKTIAFLTGQGRYLDDIVVPGACMRISSARRTPHARIVADRHARQRARPPASSPSSPDANSPQWTTSLRMAPPIEGLQPDRDDDAADRQGALHRRSGGLHRRGRPLSRGGCRRAGGRSSTRRLSRSVDLERALAPGAAAASTRRLPSQPDLASELLRRRSGASLRRRCGRGRGRIPPAPPNPRADRDARLLRHVGRRPPAPDDAHRQPGAASASAPSLRAACA